MKAIKQLIVFVSSEIFLYLLGSFVNASFDIETWGFFDRVFVACGFLAVGMIFASLAMMEIEQ
jgi:hypothetical protein